LRLTNGAKISPWVATPSDPMIVHHHHHHHRVVSPNHVHGKVISINFHQPCLIIELEPPLFNG
jgi:hypothetical protein